MVPLLVTSENLGLQFHANTSQTQYSPKKLTPDDHLEDKEGDVFDLTLSYPDHYQLVQRAHIDVKVGRDFYFL
jgi:hypothetical protein